jgi:hypothetical protein
VDELKIYNRLLTLHEISILAEKTTWNPLLSKPFNTLNEVEKCAQRLFYSSKIAYSQTMAQRNDSVS